MDTHRLRIRESRTRGVSAPARVVRELKDSEIAQLRESAAVYVANARRYKRGFAPAGDAIRTVKV